MMKTFAPSVYGHLKRMFHPFEGLMNDKGERVIIIEQIRLSKGEYVHSILAIQKTRLGNSFVANQAKNLCPFRVNFLKLKLTPKEKKALTLVNS